MPELEICPTTGNLLTHTHMLERNGGCLGRGAGGLGKTKKKPTQGSRGMEAKQVGMTGMWGRQWWSCLPARCADTQQHYAQVTLQLLPNRTWLDFMCRLIALGWAFKEGREVGGGGGVEHVQHAPALHQKRVPQGAVDSVRVEPQPRRAPWASQGTACHGAQSGPPVSACARCRRWG